MNPENNSIKKQNIDKWTPLDAFTGNPVEENPAPQATPQNAGKETAKKPKKKNWLARHAKGIAITTAVVTGLAGAGEAYNQVVLEPTKPFYHQNMESPTFDPSAINSHINAYNSVQMTLGQYEKIAPPLWNEQSNTITIPLPIKFANGRTPTLDIQKMNDGQGMGQGNNLIQIDSGLKEGDIIFAPFDGSIKVTIYPDGTVHFFYLDEGSEDSFKNSIYFDTTILKPLFDPKRLAVTDRYGDGSYSGTLSVKKDVSIAEILSSNNGQSFNPRIRMNGLSRINNDHDLNIATSQGKAIIIK